MCYYLDTIQRFKNSTNYKASPSQKSDPTFQKICLFIILKCLILVHLCQDLMIAIKCCLWSKLIDRFNHCSKYERWFSSSLPKYNSAWLQNLKNKFQAQTSNILRKTELQQMHTVNETLPQRRFCAHIQFKIFFLICNKCSSLNSTR